ncbi:MAG: hypothetical protein A2046_12915 [Bacteroidetes bacterium GWA2_30_7]|nr:MAG: hypothetical protein A2046_12915 [Bacteroidetes bacterium GWA2_30_7]
MIPYYRKIYNENFSEEKYRTFLEEANGVFNSKIQFRVAETPIFIDKKLKSKIAEACTDVVDTICRKDFKKITQGALINNFNVPNEDENTLCLCIDLGICKDENGELTPKIIEIQGFPSLYCYETFITALYRKHFNISDKLGSYIPDLTHETYIDILRKAFVGHQKVENVILLEIEPMKQGTHIDFLFTEKFLGIKTVCITEIIREGRKLFYMNNGQKTPVYRIYNRVIFDEFVKRTDLKCQFNLTEEVDVEWASHPNWFYRISKYTLPFIKSKYLPETKFLNQFSQIPEDLENYVLKPLFSFACDGIIFNVKREDIDKIKDRENYLLQRKVKYEAALQSPEGGVKAEIRILYIWEEGKERPTPVINLSRLSKGDLIGVKFNKDKTWVGGTIAFFEKD